MDAAQIATVLEGFISPDGQVRKGAEDAFNALKQDNPSSLSGLLLAVLKSEPVVERRQQAAIAFRSMLRDLFLGNKANTWIKIDQNTQEVIKLELLNLAVSERESIVRNAVGDVVSELGRCLMEKEEWPALPEALFRMVAHEDVNVQILGLNICADLEPSLKDHLFSHLGELVQMLKVKLEVPHAELRVAATSVIVQIVSNEEKSKWKPFIPFVPAIMTIIGDMAAKGDDEHCSDMIQKLMEAAEMTGEWFKGAAPQVFDTMLKIANNAELDDNTRQFAIEFLLTIVEHKPKMVQKVTGFLEKLILTLMEFMLDVDEDNEWMDRTLSLDEDEETRNYDVGEAGLDRVARFVGGEVALPIVFAQVGNFLQKNDWQHKVAGIVAISQTVEFLPEDEVDTKLGQVVHLLLGQMKDEHYRVRFAACRALGQVALDHQPHVQITYHGEVLPTLVATFDDPIARVQTQAFAAFVNFAEELEPEDLSPVVPDVMQKIMLRLGDRFSTPSDTQSSPTSVAKQHRGIREQCITSVAVISGVLAEHFVPYCATIVPLMKEVVTSCTDQETRGLRGRALECLSIIGYSVGIKHLENDIAQILQALISLFKTDMESDDPVKEYVHEALRRLIKGLKQDAAPFIPEILPIILKSFVVPEEQIDGSQSTADDYTLMFLNSGVSGIKTALLDEIELHLQLLSVIVECLGQAFGPWVTQTMAAVAPLLKMKYSDAIRRLALNCIGDLFAAARESGVPVSTISQWMLETTDTVMASMSDDLEVALSGIEHLAANVGGLSKCIDSAGPDVLQGVHVASICSKVFELIEQSSVRRAELEKAKDGSSCDEEAIDEMDEEAQREQMFRETILRVLESLLKTHPQLFVEHASSMSMQFIKSMIVNTRPADDRSLAIFICCDVLENLKRDGLALLGDVMEQIVLSVNDTTASIRQPACFAMSLAMGVEGIDKAFVDQACQRLVVVLKDPKAHAKDNKDATENALSALIVICLKQNHHLGPEIQDVANLIVANLPLKSDEEEGQRAHMNVFSDLLKNDHSVFWGPERSNLPQLVKIMGAVYKTAFSDDAVDTVIRELITARIGFANLPAIIGATSLTQLERRGLQKIERALAA